jgi:hypothetical protein
LTGAVLRISQLLEVIKHSFLECRSIDEIKRFCYAIDLNQKLCANSYKSLDSQWRWPSGLMNQSLNKRKNERHEIPLSSRYILVSGNKRKAPVSPIFHGRVREISLGGVSIICDNLGLEKLHLLSESLSGLSTKIKMKINLPDQAGPMDAACQIVHGRVMLNEKQVSLILGMQFVEVNSKHSEALRHSLDSQPTR